DPSRLRGVEKVGGGAPAAIGVAEAAGRVGDEDAAGSMMAQEVEQIAALPLGVSGALLFGEIGKDGVKPARLLRVNHRRGGGLHRQGTTLPPDKEKTDSIPGGASADGLQPCLTGGVVVSVHQLEEAHALKL